MIKNANNSPSLSGNLSDMLNQSHPLYLLANKIDWEKDDENHHHDTAFIDSTVQEKNITYHTDAKLHKKIVKKVLGIVKKLGLPLRQSYTFVLKNIYRDQRFRNHPRNRKKPSRQTEVCVQ